MLGISGRIAYIVAGFLTFGHLFNTNYVEPKDCGPEPSEYSRVWWGCTLSQNKEENNKFLVGFPAVLAGAAWPVYWATRAALVITK